MSLVWGWKCPLPGLKNSLAFGWKCHLPLAENVASLELKMSLFLGWKCPFSWAENVPVGTNSALKMSLSGQIQRWKCPRAGQFQRWKCPEISRPKKKSDILRTFSALILSGRGTFSAEKWDIFSLLGWKCPQIIIIIIIIIIGLIISSCIHHFLCTTNPSGHLPFY